MKELGVTIPENGRVSQAQFLDILKKAKAAGMEPISLGTGDRPFTGAYLSFEPMLRKLGPDDYRKLLDGKLSYADPRVVEVLNFTRQIVDLGRVAEIRRDPVAHRLLRVFLQPAFAAVPAGHVVFATCLRAAERGGQPDGFELGIMTFPEMDKGACNNCKTLAISGGYAINADAKNSDGAVNFLKEVAQPEMGELWTVNNFSLSGILFDASKVTGKNAAYFQDLAKLKQDVSFFIGIPLNFLSGECRETFVQVINVGLPAGLVTVDDAVKRMNAACYKPSVQRPAADAG